MLARVVKQFPELDGSSLLTKVLGMQYLRNSDLSRDVVENFQEEHLCPRLRVRQASLVKVAFEQPGKRSMHARSGCVGSAQHVRLAFDLVVEWEAKEVIYRERPKTINEIRQEPNHDGAQLGLGKIKHAVQLQVVHHQHVASPKVQDAVSNAKATLAAQRDEEFKV